MAIEIFSNLQWRRKLINAQNKSGNNYKWAPGHWPGNKKFIFQSVFIFFVLLSVPVDSSFYSRLFSLGKDGSVFYDTLQLLTYTTTLNLPDFLSWLIVGAVSIVGAFAWSFFERDKGLNYNQLYFWFRAFVRYRLAIGVIAFGLIKFFPLQIPYPSLSSLFTTYGQHLPWRIYYDTIGIVPWYESFLGAVEVLTGLLLLNRNTASFSAGILVGFTGNVMAANFAYNLGNQVLSSFLFFLSLTLLVNEIPRLYNLLIREHFTKAERFVPVFSRNLTRLRLFVKIAAGVFILFIAASAYSNYHNEPYLIPKSKGLTGAYGFYNVKEFKLNGQILPYSLTDSNRWQNLIFEKWSTLSIKIAGQYMIDKLQNHAFSEKDIDRKYEQAGMGERRYYSYVADTLNHTLRLFNKNPNYKKDSLRLVYHWRDKSTMILSGVNAANDSIQVRLEKVNKNYIFYEGRRKPIKM